MPFEKGQPGGPGRPPKPVEDAARSVLLELFNEKEERAIVANMIANAKRKGVVAASSATTAATWLWDRKYGKVKDQLEHSGAVELKGYVTVSPDDWDAPDPQPGDTV
jgi:hypothetical protein